MNINEVIRYPILTEKTYKQMEGHVYTFAVDKRASKLEIKKAIQFIFEVKIDKINVFNVPKKAKKVGKYSGFTKAYKKAIITLNKDSASINIFPEEGIAKDEALKKPKKDLDKLKAISEAEKKVAAKIASSKANKKNKDVAEVKETKTKIEKSTSKKVEKKSESKTSKKVVK
ncbi:MAG: 50S ribosomal protein L23 [Metamycoplasmataceae bacterium]